MVETRQTTCSIEPQKSHGPRCGPTPRLRTTAETDGETAVEAPPAADEQTCAHHRLGAARLAILHYAELLEPHAAHRLPQRRGTAGAFHRHQLPVRIPRRPDRRARPEPFGSGTKSSPARSPLRRPSRPIPRSPSIPTNCSSCMPGESYGPSEEALYGIDFPINPERVAPVLRRLVSPTKTRARIYDRDGVLLVDSRNLFGRGDVLRFDLPPPNAEKPGLFERAFIGLRALARARRSSALSRARRPERPRLSGSGAGLERPEFQHGAHQRAWRCHRLSGRPGAALPRGTRRAHALDPRRRHRRHGRSRAACHSQGLSRRHRA